MMIELDCLLVSVPVNQGPARFAVGHARNGTCAESPCGVTGKGEGQQGKRQSEVGVEAAQHDGERGERAAQQNTDQDQTRRPVVKRDGGCGFHRSLDSAADPPVHPGP